MHTLKHRKKGLEPVIRAKIADPIEKVYDLVTGDDGLPTVAVVDEVDVDAKIQAAAALSFDLAALAARIPGDDVYTKLDAMVSGGVISDPRKNKATITDMTLAPKDRADAVDIARKAKAEAKAHKEEGTDYNAIFEKIVKDYVAKEQAKATAAAAPVAEGESK